MLSLPPLILFFFFSHPPQTTHISTLSLHDALPILLFPTLALPNKTQGVSTTAKEKAGLEARDVSKSGGADNRSVHRSEEHTSELQSHSDLVCRLLLEKKKKEEQIA